MDFEIADGKIKLLENIIEETLKKHLKDKQIVKLEFDESGEAFFKKIT